MLGHFKTTAVRKNDDGLLAVMASPTVTVRHEDTGNLATLKADINGTTGKTNPFTGETDGTYEFFCEGSSQGYKIEVVSGIYSGELRYVAIGTAQYLDQDEISLPETGEFGVDLLATANAAQARALMDVEPGTDVQAQNANLATLAAAGAPTAAGLALLTAANAAAQRLALAIAGKNEIPIPAAAMQPRSANGCAALATTSGASNQPDVPYLAFDGAAKEYATFGPFRMPKSWNEGTISASFQWRRASGTGAADVVWGIRAVAVSDNETPATNFGSDATVTDAASTTTANFMASGETSACTIGGSPSEGDLVLLEVFRDGAAGGDTLNSVDAWLSSVTLYITLNETNDA